VFRCGQKRDIFNFRNTETAFHLRKKQIMFARTLNKNSIAHFFAIDIDPVNERRRSHSAENCKMSCKGVNREPESGGWRKPR
jgi:hypothetical protein